MSPQQLIPSRRPRAGSLMTLGILCAVLLFASATTGFAQINRQKNPCPTSIPARPTRPMPNAVSPTKCFWGDTHLHTGLSMDAGLFGADSASRRPIASPAAKKSWPRAVNRSDSADRSTGW